MALRVPKVSASIVGCILERLAPLLRKQRGDVERRERMGNEVGANLCVWITSLRVRQLARRRDGGRREGRDFTRRLEACAWVDCA